MISRTDRLQALYAIFMIIAIRCHYPIAYDERITTPNWGFSFVVAMAIQLIINKELGPYKKWKFRFKVLIIRRIDKTW